MNVKIYDKKKGRRLNICLTMMVMIMFSLEDNVIISELQRNVKRVWLIEITFVTASCRGGG